MQSCTFFSMKKVSFSMGQFSDKFSSIFFRCQCSSFLIYVRARQMVVLFLNKKWIFCAFDAQKLGLCYKPGNPFWSGRLSTNGLLVKVACFVKGVSHIFNIKSSWFKLVCSRRSTVLSLPFSKGSLPYAIKSFTTVHGQTLAGRTKHGPSFQLYKWLHVWPALTGYKKYWPFDYPAMLKIDFRYSLLWNILYLNQGIPSKWLALPPLVN